MRRFKYINQIKKNGHRYIYFRRPGFPAISLPLPVGSQEFIAAYYAALDATQRGQSQSPTVRTLSKQFAREARRGKSGVYLLLLGEEIVYVGSSLHMQHRVQEHRQHGRPFDKAFYIPASNDDRVILEKILIKVISPAQNCLGKNRPVARQFTNPNPTYKPRKLFLINSKP